MTKSVIDKMRMIFLSTLGISCSQVKNKDMKYFGGNLKECLSMKHPKYITFTLLMSCNVDQ